MKDDGPRSQANSGKHTARETVGAVARRLVPHPNCFFPYGREDADAIGSPERSASIAPATGEGSVDSEASVGGKANEGEGSEGGDRPREVFDRGGPTADDLAGDHAANDHTGNDHAGNDQTALTKAAASRRAKTRQRRNHRVGPLRFNDDELRIVQRAADKAGLSLGAYVTDAVVRVADAELDGLPIEREHLKDLRELHAALTGLQASSSSARNHGDPFDRLTKMLAIMLANLRRSDKRLIPPERLLAPEKHKLPRRQAPTEPRLRDVARPCWLRPAS